MSKPDTKTDILNRLSRLEGQIRGVRGMIEQDRECEQIVVQLSAIHSALESATKIAITAFFHKCLSESESRGEDRDQAIEQLTNLLLKTRL